MDLCLAKMGEHEFAGADVEGVLVGLPRGRKVWGLSSAGRTGSGKVAPASWTSASWAMVAMSGLGPVSLMSAST
jgi:hypothetical protein